MMPKPTEYQLELFAWMTLRLMAHKYAYYICDTHYVKDVTYDLEEKDWYAFGRELGLLKEDETSPCVGFSYEHPMANDAEDLSKYYMGPCIETPEILALFKKYKQE